MAAARFPVIVLFLAGVAACTLGACGSDDAGPSCNHNNVRDGDEACDGPDLGPHTCTEQTMGAKPGGTLSCKDCQLDTTACVASGAGGAGMGGGTGTGGT
ncbi:MAG TPA: hypothetical protein VH062_34360 [Polyangiaceae bacterium]|jgi:hypothetical protein|nr:hypothetical protein [Polyangiaceae bacterium]